MIYHPYFLISGMPQQITPLLINGSNILYMDSPKCFKAEEIIYIELNILTYS